MGIDNEPFDSRFHSTTETHNRLARARETTRGVDDLALEPITWKIGDVYSGLRLEKRIGDGVTSVVYRVVEVETGSQLALKILRSKSQATRTACRLGFRRMKRLQHPSLIKLGNILVVGNCDAFSMEEVVGLHLGEVIKNSRSWPREKVFEFAQNLLRQLGGAISTMHQAGLVHRDVKPENVIIDQTGRARLIDYGLIGEFDPVHDPDARRDYIAGTYWYMAPESISEQIYPPACDTYALGCILLELIANKSSLPPVVAGISIAQSVGNVREFLPPDVPNELAEMLCDMLDVERSNRPMAARLANFGTSDAVDYSTTSFFNRDRLLGRDADLTKAEQWAHGIKDQRVSRLHIYGESGSGKSWFLSELVRRIKSRQWFQVFESACNERVDVPLQVFDPMVDAIARRYSRSDREKILLKPRHALILRRAFPCLRAVTEIPKVDEEEWCELVADMGDMLDDTASSPMRLQLEVLREETLTAGVEFVERMCENGPLFLVIDDIQWADQDSINALNKIIACAKGAVGIITVGRTPEPRFNSPADVEINLTPLSMNDSVLLLRDWLSDTSEQWNERALGQLAKLGEGNVFHLSQIAACIRLDDPKNWQRRLLSSQVTICDLWQSRLDRVQPHARTALVYLATAGGPVKRIDLARASGLRGQLGSAVRDLINLQLVTDLGNRDSVEIVHHKLSTAIVEQLEPSEFQRVHNAWARYLIDDGDQATWRAARIAGHLLNAKANEEAVVYVVRAAADAESRFARVEAGRWHQLAASLMVGNDAFHHRKLALQFYEIAGRSAEAAEVCYQLLATADPAAPETREFELKLITHRLKSGQTATVLRYLDNVVERLDQSTEHAPCHHVPPVTAWTRLRDMMKDRNSSSSEAESLGIALQPPNTSGRKVDNNSGDNSAAADAASFASLILPISLVDPTRAKTLLVSIADQNRSSGAAAGYPSTDIGRSLWQCRNGGKARAKGTRRLQSLLQTSKQNEDEAGQADVIQGIAYRHLLASDWASAADTCQRLGFRSQQADNGGSGMSAVSAIPFLWSSLWLGRLKEFRDQWESLFHRANERFDVYSQRLLAAGPGVLAYLIDDEPARARTTTCDVANHFRPIRNPWLSTINGYAHLMRRVYLGDTLGAHRFFRVWATAPSREVVFAKCEMFRVMRLHTESILMLRLANEQPVLRTEHIQSLWACTSRLRGEKSAFARAIATFYDAQAHELLGNKYQCLRCYEQAEGDADSLDLVPYRLAAIDRAASVRGERQSAETRRFLSAEGVRRPEALARLYCGLC